MVDRAGDGIGAIRRPVCHAGGTEAIQAIHIINSLARHGALILPYPAPPRTEPPARQPPQS